MHKLNVNLSLYCHVLIKTFRIAYVKTLPLQTFVWCTTTYLVIGLDITVYPHKVLEP